MVTESSDREPGALPATSCVLIVDDEPMNIRLLEMALERVEGLRAVTTTNSSEAVRLFTEERPDLVLLDLHMPGLDGIEVMARLNALVAPDDFAPIIVLTADVSAKSREAVLRAGAHDFLTKPLDPVEIALRVSNVLRTRSMYVSLQKSRAEVAERLRHHEDQQRQVEARRARAVAQLQDVLDQRAITIVFQPIVRLSDSSVVGYEALSRFTQAPIRPPNEWFAEAREFGYGPQLELLALELALESMSRLSPNQFLTLNASPWLFDDSGFRSLMERSEGDRIILELTEHERIDNYPALVEQMTILRGQDYRFAVDDAGAGFASLQHIVRLKPEWIKLDIEFTRNVDSDLARQAMAASLVYFANEVSAHVISEGIETQSELDRLKEIGVTFGQGYLLGRPGPMA